MVLNDRRLAVFTGRRQEELGQIDQASRIVGTAGGPPEDDIPPEDEIAPIEPSENDSEIDASSQQPNDYVQGTSGIITQPKKEEAAAENV